MNCALLCDDFTTWWTTIFPTRPWDPEGSSNSDLATTVSFASSTVPHTQMTLNVSCTFACIGEVWKGSLPDIPPFNQLTYHYTNFLKLSSPSLFISSSLLHHYLAQLDLTSLTDNSEQISPSFFTSSSKHKLSFSTARKVYIPKLLRN